MCEKIALFMCETETFFLHFHRCRSAVLDLHVERNFIVAGGFDKKVYFIDTRSRGIVDTKRWHRQPVLCIAADDNFIISGSEDKTFCVYDRRAGYVFKSVKVHGFVFGLGWEGSVHLIVQSENLVSCLPAYLCTPQGFCA